MSLLWVSNAVFEVVAISGDSHLGGEDFTHNVVNLLASKVLHQRRQSVTSLADLQQLRTAAETIKIALSSADETRLSVPLFDGETVELVVTRPEFEEINDALFARYGHRLSCASSTGLICACTHRALVPVKAVLQEAGVTKDDVDEVVLVGGSSRIPRVRSSLAAFFGKAPNVSVNPEEAVAEGAAMHAGILTDSWPVTAAAVERVRPRSSSKAQ